MKHHVTILLGGPSLFVLAAAAGQPSATAQPAAQSADPATAAQEVNEAAEQAGQEGAIIITARRRAESLLEVPQTVQAVTGKDLQDYNLFRFEDIQQLVSGLTITAPVSGIGVAASVRGATFSVNTQGSPTVETYFNEHPVQASMMFQSQFDIGQIEVLKGPQGTLRGRSSPSGAMTLTTRRPDLNEVGGAISFTGTSRGGINMQAALGVPLIQDVLAIRVAGLVDETEGNGVESATSHREPSDRTRAIRATLRFEPTDTLSAILMYQRVERRSRSFGGALFGTGAGVNTAPQAGVLTAPATVTNRPDIGCTAATPCAVTLIRPGGRPAIFAPAGFNGPPLGEDDYLSVQDFPSLTKQNVDIATAQIDWSFSGQRLSYVGGYSKIFVDGRGGGGDASNTIVGRQDDLNAGTHATEKRLTNELRLSSEERLFGMIDYTIGGYHGKTTGDTNNVGGTNWAGAFGSPLGAAAAGGPGLLSPFTFDSRYGLNSNRHGTRKEIEKSAFANVIAHLFNDKLELEAGGRRIWYSNAKAQVTEFSRGLVAMRNPNGLGDCPDTLSGTTNSGGVFIDAPVAGSTYAGTCDVQTRLGNGINASGLDSPLTSRKFKAFVYRLSASYHFTPDLIVYFTRGTAWRPGPGPITGAPNCAAANTPDFPSPDLCDKFNFLDPDKNRGIELGFKGAFFDRRLTFTAAAYKQEFSGFFAFVGRAFAMTGNCVWPHIVGDTTQPAGCTVSGNNGTPVPSFNAPVQTKGMDAEVNFRASDDLRFGGRVSWATGKFGDADIPCFDTNFDGIPDASVPSGFTATQFLDRWPGGGPVGEEAYGIQLCNTSTNPALKPSDNPKWNFNLNGEVSHEVFTGGKAFLRALFSYTPKNKNSNPVTTFIPRAYGILNLFAGLRGDDGSWEVSVSARNILNNKTVLSRGGGATASPQQLTRPPGAPGEQLSFAPVGNLSGYTTISFVPRREFQLSARFAFGSR